jgi:hypothetical protein
VIILDLEDAGPHIRTPLYNGPPEREPPGLNACDEQSAMINEKGTTVTQHERDMPGGGDLRSGRIDVHAHFVPAELQASVPPCRGPMWTALAEIDYALGTLQLDPEGTVSG